MLGAQAAGTAGQLAVLNCFNSLQLWDVKKRALIHTLKGTNKVNFRSTKLAFSPDGRLLAVPRGEGVHMMDVAGWKRAAQLQGHTGRVTAVAFSPDGALVATASEDGTVQVWNAGPGEPLPADVWSLFRFLFPKK